MEPYFEKYFYYTITDKEYGLTVERFLLSIGYSRHLLIRIKQTPSGITVNGLPVYTSYILKAGDLLTVLLKEETFSANIVPSPIPFDIIYEDDDILVINKEANIPIHPSQGNFSNTLANGAAWYFRQKGEPFVYRAVNRLDRDTTGLLILARHGLSACILSDSIARRTIHREYLAICDGLIPWQGTVSAPIGRLCHSSIQRCVDFEHGEPAITHYHRISYNPKVNLSLVSLSLETGRTHQIRVHMKYIGHPLPGDFLYHPDYRLIARQALHSHRLSFCHPITKKELHFEAPLPDDMKQAMNCL
ncbi:RluA family pseudouridine synthase [Lachnospiraceae bacterium 62-35]